MAPSILGALQEQYDFNNNSQIGDSTPAATSRPKRVTVVSVGSEVVLIEEWDSKKQCDEYCSGSSLLLQTKLMDLIKSHSEEYFPESLHVCKGIEPTQSTIGILVRQKTKSTENGGILRDAQREAYERQMPLEEGCTCSIILAGSELDKSQVRIVELWKTMKDFHFHETSDWHSNGEEKVVPLVIDMDCDFVKGWQLIQG